MKIEIKILLLIFLLSFSGCDLKDLATADSFLGARDSTVSAKIAKWYNDHKAAIVITNDAGLTDPAEFQVQEFAHKAGVTINYEIVTNDFVNQQSKIDKIFNQLFPFGHGIYGHGHWHYNHDQLSYDEAFDSFRKCYKILDSLGLGTVTYAYPGGNGYKLRTRKALKDAGFLAGRYFDQLGHLDPYIVPDDNPAPADWYALPTLVMQDYGYDACDICINNTQELIPFLDEAVNRTALIIITYHAIGQYNSYGYYDFENYKKDILEIAKKDFWTALFDDAVLYIYERENAQAKVIWHFNNENNVNKISVTLSDKYSDNITFRQPLTILFNIPQNWIDKEISISQNGRIMKNISSSNSIIKVSLPPDESTYTLTIN